MEKNKERLFYDITTFSNPNEVEIQHSKEYELTYTLFSFSLEHSSHLRKNPLGEILVHDTKNSFDGYSYPIIVEKNGDDLIDILTKKKINIASWISEKSIVSEKKLSHLLDLFKYEEVREYYTNAVEELLSQQKHGIKMFNAIIKRNEKENKNLGIYSPDTLSRLDMISKRKK